MNEGIPVQEQQPASNPFRHVEESHEKEISTFELNTLRHAHDELADKDPQAAYEAFVRSVGSATLSEAQLNAAQEWYVRGFIANRTSELIRVAKQDIFQALAAWQGDTAWASIDRHRYMAVEGVLRLGFSNRLFAASNEADFADVLRRIPKELLPSPGTLVNAAFTLQGSTMKQAERSRHVLDLLKGHPRTLVESGSLVHGIVFTDADRGDVFDCIAKDDEKDPVLGKFSPGNLPKDMRERAAAIIFEQRLVQNPSSIIGEFELFRGQFDKLSEEEKSRVLHSAMEIDPWAIIRHASVVRGLGYTDVFQQAIYTCASKDFSLFETHANELALLPPEQQRELADTWMLSKGLEKKKVPFMAKASWASAIEKLEHLQAHAANDEHDPWATDLKPLIQRAAPESIVDEENEADGEIVVEYVKQYGMLNMPIVFRWHVALSRVKSIEDLKPEVRDDISAFLGKPIEKFSNKGFVTQEIKRAVAELRSKLLDGSLTSEMLRRHAACEEMVSAAIGTTVWAGGGRKLADLQETWEKNISKNPEQARLPEGYETVHFEVREVEHSESRSVEEQREKIENNPGVSRQVGQWIDSFAAGTASSEVAPSEWATWRRKDMKGHTEKTLRPALIEKIAQASNEKAKQGLEKKLHELEGAQEIIESGLRLDQKDPDAEPAWTEALAAMASLPKGFELRAELLRHISARHMYRLMSEPRRRAIEEISSDSALEEWRSIMLDYVNEHYLNEKQQPEHTGHPPFNAKTLEALRYAWGLAKPDTNPVIDAAKRLRELEQGTSTGKTKAVDLVPVTGLMRITAGDAGDACYTSKHDALAKGDYPDLHAFVFVTGRGTPQERMQGSVLAIETEDEDGNKTLLVRANNPRMSLLSAVEPSDLIGETLAAMKATAARRGVEQVVVPLDRATASCSNRAEVAEEYYAQSLERDVRRVGLRQQPETEFNGYDNWNKEGEHFVVTI